MAYPENQFAESHRTEIAALIESAIGGDVLNDSGGGFVGVMAKSNPNVMQDIPAAFEMYTLLSHYLGKLPIYSVTLSEADVLLAPSVLYDVAAKKVLVLIAVNARELDMIAYWAAGGIRSDTVRAMAGVLALPFSIETHDDTAHLIPEWFAAFYVGGNEDHCIPSLTLRSITLDERMGDWVAVALKRMPTFGLPCASASNATQHKTSH
jgi:hypothetical protein